MIPLSEMQDSNINADPNPNESGILYRVLACMVKRKGRGLRLYNKRWNCDTLEWNLLLYLLVMSSSKFNRAENLVFYYFIIVVCCAISNSQLNNIFLTCYAILCQDVNIVYIIQELLPVLPGISAKVLPEVLNRLSSRVFARLIRETFL